jgi:uncharacterized membrane protein
MAKPVKADQQTISSSVPGHVQQGIDTIVDVHARHLQEVPRARRLVERMVSWVARPSFIVALTVVIVAWISANLALMTTGHAFDPPPFPILQDIGTGLALYITVLILITAQREKEIGEHREQLTLQLAILSEQKSAKTIQLIEEARRDNPMIGNREDAEATELGKPTDPAAVLDAIKDTQGKIGQTAY